MPTDKSNPIRRLELGCGGRRTHKHGDGDGDINIAIDYYQYNETDPEIIHDLALGLPWGKEARGVKIEKETFDDIYASHLLEHIGIPVTLEEQYQKGLWKLLMDVYDALKIGGTFRGAVPIFSNAISTLDPSHVTHWHPETFSYLGYHNHDEKVSDVQVSWIPGFREDEKRYFYQEEIDIHNDVIGFILTRKL